jgi:hypothetical protein
MLVVKCRFAATGLEPPVAVENFCWARAEQALTSNGFFTLELSLYRPGDRL